MRIAGLTPKQAVRRAGHAGLHRPADVSVVDGRRAAVRRPTIDRGRGLWLRHGIQTRSEAAAPPSIERDPHRHPDRDHPGRHGRLRPRDAARTPGSEPLGRPRAPDGRRDGCRSPAAGSGPAGPETGVEGGGPSKPGGGPGAGGHPQGADEAVRQGIPCHPTASVDRRGWTARFGKRPPRGPRPTRLAQEAAGPGVRCPSPDPAWQGAGRPDLLAPSADLHRRPRLRSPGPRRAARREDGLDGPGNRGPQGRRPPRLRGSHPHCRGRRHLDP